jgi:thiol-disulfide isomerase/thioredoxin
MKKRIFSLFVLLLLADCRQRSPMPENSSWTGTVELPDGISVPLRMNLDLSGAKPNGYFLVGDEKTPIPEIERSGDSLTLSFSEYGAEIRSTWDGSRLAGNYLRIRADGTKSFKFTATPSAGGSAGRDVPESAGVALPDGNFQVVFQGEQAPDTTTVAKFWSNDHTLSGTFIAPDGDYGLHVGAAAKGHIQLSRFTGWQATALVLEPNAGAWSGKFYAASNAKPIVFTLQPKTDLNVELPVSRRPVMKDASAEFVFSGVSLDGETMRNTDERLKGKALILDIMGTWCHNCLDEAPVLNELQQEFGKDGLEVVGLSFEIGDDPAVAKKNLQLFKDRFGLTYALLFCGSLDDGNVKQRLHSQIDNFFAYPTAIFIDKNHKVRSIHSGFKGPGTGGEFQSQIREFRQLAADLVAPVGRGAQAR